VFWIWILGTASATFLVNRTLQLQRLQLQAQGAELSAVRAAKSAAEIHQSKVMAELEALNSTIHDASSNPNPFAPHRTHNQNPAPDWSQPPDSLPDWNPDSPYIWLARDSIARLPIGAFLSDGKLDPDLNEMLGIPPSVSQSLNSNLLATLHRYEQLETERAIRTNAIPIGPAYTVNKSITIIIPAMPEEVARMKAEFIQGLVQSLGSQRADLVMTLGRDWISERFSFEGSAEKTYVVGITQDGAYDIRSSSGGAYRMLSGPHTLDGCIPNHLLPLFDELKLPQPKTSP
jgi:hypothetical protein